MPDYMTRLKQWWCDHRFEFDNGFVKAVNSGKPEPVTCWKCDKKGVASPGDSFYYGGFV